MLTSRGLAEITVYDREGNVVYSTPYAEAPGDPESMRFSLNALAEKQGSGHTTASQDDNPTFADFFNIYAMDQTQRTALVNAGSQ